MTAQLANDIKEARSRISDLERQRVKLASRKNSLLGQLSKIKRCLNQNNNMMQNEFNDYYHKKLSIGNEIVECDKIIRATKQEQQRWRMIADSLEKQAISEIRENGNIFAVASDSPVRKEIVYLCDKYMNFAEDHTRVNSMRLMAAQFANELTEILKINCLEGN
jgi:hypothetical protein